MLLAKTNRSGIVDLHRRGWLVVAHFFLCDAHWDSVFGSKESGSNFSFHGQAHYCVDNFSRIWTTPFGFGVFVGVVIGSFGGELRKKMAPALILTVSSDI